MVISKLMGICSAMTSIYVAQFEESEIRRNGSYMRPSAIVKYFIIAMFIGKQAKPRITKIPELSKNSQILLFLDSSC